MQPANPQPQPAADDSANAVTEIAARVEAIHDFEWDGEYLAEVNRSGAWDHWARKPYSTEACDFIAHAPDDIRYLLAALTREREALAAMSTRALAAEAALNNLQDKGYEFVKSLDNYKAVAYWQDQARITGRDAWLDTLNLFTEFTDLCYTTEVEARIHLAASADEPTGGVNDADL